jgi:hypothetical protein
MGMFAGLASGMLGGGSSIPSVGNATGGTAGPATNSAVNVTGSVGSLSQLAQLMSLTGGPTSTGGIPWNSSVYNTPAFPSPIKTGPSMTLLLVGAVALVAIIFLMKK